MLSRTSWRTAGSMLFGLLVLAVVHRLSLPTAVARGDALEAAPETLSIGPIDPVPGYEHRLLITNTSDESIQIDEFLTTCTCINVSPPNIVVESSAEETIVLKIDLPRYVTPGREPLIQGSIQVTPVVAGRRVANWNIALALHRPKLLTMSGELHFGTIYDGDDQLVSRESVFISTDVPQEDIRVSTTAPFVRAAKLFRLSDLDGSYGEYRIQETIAPGSRTHGLEQFAVEIVSASESLTVSCTARFDSGLRLHVTEPPPVIVSVGDEVQWIVTAYNVMNNVERLTAELSSPAEAAISSVSTPEMDDGIWRLACHMTPKSVGNIPCTLSVTAELDNGETVSTARDVSFYVPISKGN